MLTDTAYAEEWRVDLAEKLLFPHHELMLPAPRPDPLLPDDAMRGEFSALFEHGVSAVEREARMKTFMQKLQAHKKSCLPPWHTEMTQTAQERAA